MLPHALFHPIVTFILVNLLAAAFWLDPAAILEPSAFHLLVRIQYRLRGVIEVVIHVSLMASIVAFLFVYVLPSSRHVYHAAELPKLARHQFFGIADISDRRGREIVADIAHTLEPVLVDAIFLVDAASPRHCPYPASSSGVRTLYQIIVAVLKIGRHVFFLQVRSKLTSEITILTSLY